MRQNTYTYTRRGKCDRSRLFTIIYSRFVIDIAFVNLSKSRCWSQTITFVSSTSKVCFMYERINYIICLHSWRRCQMRSRRNRRLFDNFKLHWEIIILHISKNYIQCLCTIHAQYTVPSFVWVVNMFSKTICLQSVDLEFPVP